MVCAPFSGLKLCSSAGLGSLCVLELSSFPASLTLVPLVLHRTYNPEDGRALKKAATQEQAMQELVEVVSEAYRAETSALLTVHPQRWPPHMDRAFRSLASPVGCGSAMHPVHISPCALIPSYTCALLR